MSLKFVILNGGTNLGKRGVRGAGRYDETKKIVERYISECNKSPEDCDLSFVHLTDN